MKSVMGVVSVLDRAWFAEVMAQALQDGKVLAVHIVAEADRGGLRRDYRSPKAEPTMRRSRVV